MGYRTSGQGDTRPRAGSQAARRPYVVYPERAMGEQVLPIGSEGWPQYLEFDDDFAIARTMAYHQ